MNRDDLNDIIGRIDDDLILDADSCRVANTPKKHILIKWCAVAACMCLIVAAITQIPPVFDKAAVPAYAESVEAKYPDTVKYPEYKDSANKKYQEALDEWYVSRSKQLNQYDGYLDGMEPFYSKTVTEFLSDSDGENIVYSPINVYMAMSLLAETSAGDSRDELLKLLNTDDVETLRNKNKALWNANYFDDGIVTSVLANSLWLNEELNYKNSTLRLLADNYYASSYSGEIRSDGFTQAFRDWLNKQTGNMLTNEVKGLEMGDVATLASTVYYKAQWSNPFSEYKTEKNVFKTKWRDITCDFMNKSSVEYYYIGDNFSATRIPLEYSGYMWFVLPDEGVSVDEVVKGSSMLDVILNEEAWQNRQRLLVNISVPKFDVKSNLQLVPELKKLGVNTIFKYGSADFTPLTEDVGVFINSITHAARVVVDEKGCTAAAFTVSAAKGSSSAPTEEIDFVLNRPFIFAITGADGTPLFIGVVNRPI